MKKKKAKYTKDMPRMLYSYFLDAVASGEIPSISKFARRIAMTVDDIEGFRAHGEFEKAYKEVNEIRRDYLIDSALLRKFDSSFTKFILSAEYGEGTDGGADDNITVSIKVED